jgi:hypothetical protein
MLADSAICSTLESAREFRLCSYTAENGFSTAAMFSSTAVTGDIRDWALDPIVDGCYSSRGPGSKVAAAVRDGGPVKRMILRRKFGHCGHRGGRGSALGAATVALSLLCVPALPGFADDGSQGAAAQAIEIRRQIRDVESDPDIQTEIRSQIEQAEADPGIQKERPEAAPEPKREQVRLHLPAWLPYVILGLAGFGMLFLIVRAAVLYRRPQANVTATATAAATSGKLLPPNPKEHDPSFDEVDALAAAGAFAEAIHKLLLLAQARLLPRLESGMQPSLTSREIMRRAKLPGEAATAFGRLVGAVELTLFGMHAANAAIYAACREDCRLVLEAAA